MSRLYSPRSRGSCRLLIYPVSSIPILGSTELTCLRIVNASRVECGPNITKAAPLGYSSMASHVLALALDQDFEGESTEG